MKSSRPKVGKRLRIAIVGAGPAGLSAALELARLGHDATVFEKHAEVGVPVRCGECLVDPYGLLDREPAGARVRVQEVCIKLRDLHVFPTSDMNVWVLDKDKWLQSMAAEAQSQEVHLVLEARRSISQLRRDFEYVLDCSGCPSQSSKEYQVDCGAPGLAVQWTVRADVAARLGRLYLHFEPGEVGYRWIFPKSAREANVGAGWAKDPPAGKWGALRDFASRELGRFDILRSTAGHVPSRIVKNPFFENVLLCGAAAGLVNPYTGAGIHTAVLSGVLAARCLAEGCPGSYRARLLLATGPEFRVAAFARCLLESSYRHHERAIAYVERHFPLRQVLSGDAYRRLSPIVYIWKIRTALLDHVLDGMESPAAPAPQA